MSGIVFSPSFSLDHLQRYSRIIQEGVGIRSHLDLLRWLQGEVQHYLPHEVMFAAWGDFSSKFIRYDIVSSLPRVRTIHLEPEGLSYPLKRLHKLWIGKGKQPCFFEGSIQELYQDSDLQSSFGKALQGMQSSLLHGISDERGSQDCLYIIFSSKNELNSSTTGALGILLPSLDAALRQVVPLPPNNQPKGSQAHFQQSSGMKKHEPEICENHDLSKREAEIMEWVKAGKTNAEIGIILGISAFTVKNHLQHIFHKLKVYNRIQAVSRLFLTPS